MIQIQPLLVILGGLVLVGLFFSVQDQKIRLDQKYVLGQKICDEKVCVTPFSISEDRMTAHLLVYSFDTNTTCIQDINNGYLVPLYFYDCRPGSDWNGEQSSSGIGVLLD